MRWVRRWIGVALIAAVLIGGWSLKAENAESIDVDFLFGEIRLEIWQALLCAFATGFALAGAGWLWSGLRSGMTVRRYRREVAGLEAEVHQLRNLPLATGHAPPPQVGRSDSSAGHDRGDPRGGALSRAIRPGG